MVAQASLADVTFYGVTRSNLLGDIGNFEKDSDGDGVADGVGKVSGTFSLSTDSYCGLRSQRVLRTHSTENRTLSIPDVPISSGKYYLFIGYIKPIVGSSYIYIGQYDSNGSISNTFNTPTASDTTKFTAVYKKFTPDASVVKGIIRGILPAQGNEVLYDAFGLFEVTAAEYPKIDAEPEWTGDKLIERFFPVNGTKHLQGVGIKKTGKNLFQPFTGWKPLDSSKWTINSPYSATVRRTASGQGMQYEMPCFPNTTYTCSVTSSSASNGIMSIYLENATGTQIAAYNTALIFTRTFTTPANAAKIIVILAGTLDDGSAVTFDDPQLELGPIKTSFEGYSADYIWLPTILASNPDGSIRDIAYERENVWYKYRRWQTGVKLDGVSPIWRNYAGSVAGAKRAYYDTVLPTSRVFYLTRYDGSRVPNMDVNYNIEAATIGGDNYLHVSVPNSFTGFSDDHAPSNSDWGAFFRGWKMNNGTLGTPYPGTGTKYWTPIVTPKANLVGKVSTSLVENPHSAYASGSSTLMMGTGGTEHNQTDYNRYAALDGDVKNNGTSTAGGIAQIRYKFDIISHIIRNHGLAVFGEAVTTADRVAWCKAGNLARVGANLFASGSGPGGNKVSFAALRADNNTLVTATGNNTSSAIARIVFNISSSNAVTIVQALDANGFMHFLAYADASDGVVPSSVLVDTIDLDVELNVQTVPTTGYSSVEYTPYMLDYALAQPVEEPIVGAEGSLSLAAGGNVVELFEGIVRETVIPTTGTSTADYHINAVGVASAADNPLAYRTANILRIYKNDVDDTKNWSFNVSLSYGGQRAYQSKTIFDPTAKYKVVYTVLDKHLYTCNAVEAKVEYKSTAKSIQGDLVQQVADLETQASISINAVAAIYARLKAGGL
jgi:hypothetical protein